MKQKIYVTLILLFISILVITALYFIAENLNQHPNHFQRKFSSYSTELVKTIDLDNSSYYIAGLASNTVYLGSEVSPLSFLIINIEDGKTIRTKIRNIDDSPIRSGRLWVDSPYFYLADRVRKMIYRGLVTDSRVTNIIYDSLASDLSIPMSNNSLALRIFTDHGFDYTLGKEWIFPHATMAASEILEKRKDGIFSNDGMLDYDREVHKLIYVFYYRNQYIILDTNLNLVSRANTIDTTNNPGVKTAMIQSDNSFVLDGPLRIVNQCSYCFGNRLFINSTLRADNEERSSFRRSGVIDVYDLEKGVYQYSFYLPKYRGNKIKNFGVANSCIAAIAGSYLLLYKFQL